MTRSSRAVVVLCALTLCAAAHAARAVPAVFIRTFEAAGLKLEAQSDLLRNPADRHELRVNRGWCA